MADGSGISFALFTLSPVAEDSDEWFASFFENETIVALGNLGLGLEIAPESVLPEAPFWAAVR
jgi:hypothetical protein